MAEVLYQILGRHRRRAPARAQAVLAQGQGARGENYLRLKQLMRELDLHTVCEEAHCPNVGECWEHGTATFMILGDVCTRNCAYCAVAHGRPPKFDPAEPGRVAEAAKKMNLQHLVITSVDRDDLPDFGAWAFAETIRQVHEAVPGCSVEVLVPDFQGVEDSIRTVLEARPEIYNHNTETVPRLYKKARPGGRYERVLEIFRISKRIAPDIPTKTGIILGMGETNEEVLETMRELREVDVDILTLGQYLKPSDSHIALDRYVTPEEFTMFRDEGKAMGFKHVESGPSSAPATTPGSRCRPQASPPDVLTRSIGRAQCGPWCGPSPPNSLTLPSLCPPRRNQTSPQRRRRHAEGAAPLDAPPTPLRGEGRRGLRPREDRRLLPPLHRAGSRLHRHHLDAAPRRLRHHHLP
jgi:lipoyl synthase